MSIFYFFTLPPQEFIFKFWVPFLISFTLFFAILEGVKIFNKKINFIISLSATLLFANSPFFITFSEYFTAYAAFFVFAAFIALFGVGVMVMGGKRLKAIWIEEELKKINQELEIKRKQFEEAAERKDEVRAALLKEEINELIKKKKELLQP